MGNPVANMLEKEFSKTPAGYPAMPGYQRGGARAGGQDAYANAPVREDGSFKAAPSGYDMFGQPEYYTQSAPGEVYDQQAQPQQARVADGGAIGRPMTMNDVMIKSWICFAVLLIGAFGGWTLSVVNPAMGIGIMTVGALGALVMAVIQMFKSNPSRILILGYAVFEGATLGAISQFTNARYPGIALQALVGTVCVILVCLLLFRSGLVRVNSTFAKVALISVVAVMLYSLINFILMLTGVVSNPLGLDGITVFGIPLGIFVGLFAIVAGAMSLIMDFNTAVKGVENGVDSRFAWMVSFSIMVSVVWLYLEILRILQLLEIFSQDN